MKLIEALDVLKPTRRGSAGLEVSLACGFSPLHFQTFLNAHLQTLFPQSCVEIKSGLFGDLAGNIERLVTASAPAAVVIEWSDLDPRLSLRRLGGWSPQSLPDIARSVRDQCERYGESLEKAARVHPVALSLPTLPLPPVGFTPGWCSSSLASEVREAVAALGSRLSSSTIRIVNPQRLDRISPPGSRLDVKSEISAGFPYTLGHADALAGLIARIIQNPLPKKGLITDLDDTLWKGILGEVGVDGVRWDLDHHAQSHGLYQQLLSSLAGAGTLIGVASKNDPALVEEAFQRAKPPLSREQIFPAEVNWGPKSQSVARILRAWNIGADSVVFVDDSPLELAEVQASFPEIDCRLFPRQDDRAVYELLEDLRDIFGKQSVSAEDKIRLESLRAAEAASEALRTQQASPDRFLREVQGELSLSFTKDPKDARPLELVNKTNQFNLNGKHRTEVSWNEYLNDPEVFLLVAAYQDKYGPLGKIAVIGGRKIGDALAIDHWVMSCRAFSRRIEHACLLHLFRKFNAKEASFDFALTARNGPLQSFFSELKGAPAAAAFSIARQEFVDHCPPVYLRIVERSDD